MIRIKQTLSFNRLVVSYFHTSVLVTARSDGSDNKIKPSLVGSSDSVDVFVHRLRSRHSKKNKILSNNNHTSMSSVKLPKENLRNTVNNCIASENFKRNETNREKIDITLGNNESLKSSDLTERLKTEANRLAKNDYLKNNLTKEVLQLRTKQCESDNRLNNLEKHEMQEKDHRKVFSHSKPGQNHGTVQHPKISPHQKYKSVNAKRGVFGVSNRLTKVEQSSLSELIAAAKFSEALAEIECCMRYGGVIFDF